MNKALIAYLRIYDKYDNRLKDNSPLVKDYALKFFNMATNVGALPGAETDFIKELPNTFKLNAEKLGNYTKYANATQPDTSSFIGTSIAAVKNIFCQKFDKKNTLIPTVIDGKAYIFNNLDTNQFILYGLGYSEPSLAESSVVNDVRIDNAQIISTEPLIVSITENNMIQDVKLITSPYTCVRVDIDNPLQYKTETELYKQVIEELEADILASGVAYDRNTFVHQPINYTESRVVGEYDKKDTTGNIDDLYRITKIDNIRSAVITKFKHIYRLEDSNTGEVIMELNPDGTRYEGPIVEITEEKFMSSTPYKYDEFNIIKYTVKAMIGERALSIAEMKVDDRIGEAIKNEIIKVIGKGVETELGTLGYNDKIDNITGTTVTEQPFSGMPSVCINEDLNSYNVQEVGDYIESLLLSGVEYIVYNNKILKVTNVNKIRTADFSYLEPGKLDDVTRDANTELVIYKNTIGNNRAFMGITPDQSFADNIRHLIFKTRLGSEIYVKCDLTIDTFDNPSEMIKKYLPLTTKPIIELDYITPDRLPDLSKDGYTVGDFLEKINVYNPVSLSTKTDGTGFITSTISFDLRTNNINQDVKIDISTIDIDAEEPVKEIRLEDIEVTIEKINTVI